MSWFNPSGASMRPVDWEDPSARCVSLYLDGVAEPDVDRDGVPMVDDDLLILINGWRDPVDFEIPPDLATREMDGRVGQLEHVSPGRRSRCCGRRCGRPRLVHPDPEELTAVTVLADLVPILADVNPVPWARAQMAFTLAFHIMLVPLGVSWAAMTLIANYKAIRHDDADALLLAQRWSKYMAVTFAVGAVTGTVLSFEFGLLWPRFMGQWGEAFGVPFAFEGLFFFTEAVFVSIYIFGWRRLKPWAHFWTGVPIVIAGIMGSASVVAANAWMNSPSGFTLDSAGDITEVDPWAVIFNDAMPLMAAHMVVAAYVVGGFLVASVYAVGMLRGRRDRYHRLGFLIPFTVAAIAIPIQMGVGDSLARWVYNNQPIKFAAIEMVPETTSDVPETIFGHLDSDGTVTGGIPIPGWRRGCRIPRPGSPRWCRASTPFPSTSDRRSARSTRSTWPGTSWSVSAPCCCSSPSGSGHVALPARHAPSRSCSCWVASSAGVLAVITMEAGWVVSEVGRQPWIVYEYMKVEDAATANTGVWITFLAVTALYIGLGITTVLMLRGMSRRFRLPRTRRGR